MGLFSTLSSSSSKETTVRSSSSSSSSSCLSLPTVVQLYGGGKCGRPIKLLQSTCQIPSFAVLTYQAVPTVAMMSAIVDMQQQQHHQMNKKEEGSVSINKNTSNKQRVDYMKRMEILMAVPDLGVWNCCVPKSSHLRGGGAAAVATGEASLSSAADGSDDSPTAAAAQQTPLVDSLLLQTIIPTICKTFCFTIDLSHQSQVEPTLTRLQEALVRYLIVNGKEMIASVSSSSSSSTLQGESACTTSLFQLRSVQFGLAELDEASAAQMISSAAPDVADHNVKVALLICAQLGASSQQASSSSSSNNDASQPEPATTSNAVDYKYKQGQALLIYHLRRYAAALNAHLCFVQAPPTSSQLLSPLEQQTASALDVTTVTGHSTTNTSTSTDPPALTYPQVGLVWRALAQGQVIWRDIKSILEMEEATTTTTPAEESQEGQPEAVASAESSPEQEKKQQDVDDDDDGAHSLVYGPGNCQLDLVETVLLRHAHYPGHWDASRESVWNIFPSTAPEINKTTTSAAASSSSSSSSSGDEAWLTEIRDSIATTTAVAMQTPEPKKNSGDRNAAAAVEQTPDAGATDFFKSLLG